MNRFFSIFLVAVLLTGICRANNATDTVVDPVLNREKPLPKITCNCPEPSRGDFKSIPGSIAIKEPTPKPFENRFEYGYEVRLLQMACVDLNKDNNETALQKMHCFWEKYKTKFSADAAAFDVPNGNILKFSLSRGYFQFIELLAGNYGLDINFIDPADNRNVLDYVLETIAREKKVGNDNKVRIYEEYKSALIRLGGRPSNTP